MYRPSHAQRMYRPAHARQQTRVALLSKALVLVALFGLTATSAWAGSPHFVGTPTVTRSGDTLTVAGKVAGLGNEDQVHVTVSAEAACLNPGQNFPQAANKMTVTAGGDFPVQNGKALFSLSLTAVFQPKCSPPMSVVFGPVTITVSDDTPPASFSPFSTTISGPGPGGTF
jgi:hypothetical protein